MLRLGPPSTNTSSCCWISVKLEAQGEVMQEHLSARGLHVNKALCRSADLHHTRLSAEPAWKGMFHSNRTFLFVLRHLLNIRNKNGWRVSERRFLYHLRCQTRFCSGLIQDLDVWSNKSSSHDAHGMRWIGLCVRKGSVTFGLNASHSCKSGGAVRCMNA